MSDVMIGGMATRETRVDRGRRRGRLLQARMLSEVRTARMVADVSQRSMAASLGWSQAEYWRFENGKNRDTSIGDLSAVVALLGLELSCDLHRAGDAIIDRGHQELIGRFRALLSAAYRVMAEAPLPRQGDPRSWDLLLRLDDQLVGVEAETKIRDIQTLIRHIRGRERDGGTDEVLLILARTHANRAAVDELRTALGARFATPARSLLGALRGGTRLPGSGVVLV